MERVVYDTNNQLKRTTFECDQEGQFCLGVAKVESKEDETIKENCCPVFKYTGKKMFTIDAYKKEILNEFARISKLISSLSP